MNDYLISYQEAENYLFKQGYTAPGNIDSENNIKIFREASADAIEKYLGYAFSSKTYTDKYYNGNSTHIMYLDHRPITALSAVEISDSTITASDVSISGEDYLYYEDGYFTTGIHNVKLTYTAGYTRTTMPGIFRLTALRLVGFYYNLQNREGTSSESRENGSSSSIDLNQKNEILSDLMKFRS